MDVTDLAPQRHDKRNDSAAQVELTVARKSPKVEAPPNLDSLPLEVFVEICRWLSITDVHLIGCASHSLESHVEAVTSGAAGIDVFVSMVSRTPAIPSRPYVSLKFVKFRYSVYSENVSCAMSSLGAERMKKAVALLPSHVLHMLWESKHMWLNRPGEVELLTEVIKAPLFPYFHPCEQDTRLYGNKYRTTSKVALRYTRVQMLPHLVQFAPSVVPSAWDIDEWWIAFDRVIDASTQTDEVARGHFIGAMQTILRITCRFHRPRRMVEVVLSLFMLFHASTATDNLRVWRLIFDPAVVDRGIQWNWAQFLLNNMFVETLLTPKANNALLTLYANDYRESDILRLWQREVNRLQALSSND